MRILSIIIKMKKPESLSNNTGGAVANHPAAARVNEQQEVTRASLQTRGGGALGNNLATPKKELEGHVHEVSHHHGAHCGEQPNNDHDFCGAPGYNTAKGATQQPSENSRQSAGGGSSHQTGVNRSMGSLQITKAASIQGNYYGPTAQGPSQSQILVDNAQKSDQKRLLLQSLAQANGGVAVSASLSSQLQQHTPSSQIKKNPAYVKPPIAAMSTSQSQSQINLSKTKALIPPSVHNIHHQTVQNEDLEEAAGDDDFQIRRVNRTQDPKKNLARRTFESSGDKVKNQGNKNVSPYSIKTFPKFPRQGNGVPHLQSSSVNSDTKAKKNLSQQLNNVADIIQPILQQQNNQAQGFKSQTSFSQSQQNHQENGLKQHLPPLDPKGNAGDTPGAPPNQSSKKKFSKTGGVQQPFQEANSFLDSASRVAGVNVKRIVPTSIDYDQQLLSEEDLSQLEHQPPQQDNFMYRRISQHGDQKHQHSRYNQKHQMLSQSPYNTTQATQEMIQNNLVPPQQLHRERGNNSNSKSKGGHSTSLTKHKRKDQSPNLFQQPSRNLVDPRVGVFQSQNLMLVHDPSRVSPQPRPQESHSHTRTMKFRYQQQNQQAQQNKKGLMFVPNQSSLMDLPVAHTMEYRKGSKGRANKHESDIPLQTLPAGGMKFQNFHTFDNNLGPLSQFSDRLTSGIQRDSMFHGGGGVHDNLMSNDNLFSGDRGFQFSDRFSSIDQQQDELENTIKIGRGGSGDADEDVRLFRDIEIRLKIEPLTLKLLHSITEKIRAHVAAQGKPALGNLVALLYQQCAKLTQRMTLQSPSLMSDQSRNIIKQLQVKNQDLNTELGALQSEVRALRIGQGIDGGSNNDENGATTKKNKSSPGGHKGESGNAYYVHQVQELKRRNYELQNDMEQLRERLQMYENMSENEEQPSKSNLGPPQKVEIIKTKMPSGIPKLNLQKALSINMKVFKSQQPQQFQVPLESSNRGSYMSFKLTQQNFADEEGIPVTSNINQPLVRPTTTMGGRKKLVFNKGASNEDHHLQQQIIEERQNSHEELSEVSGEHSLGGGPGHTLPNMDSIHRPIHKKIKLKKLTTQNMEDSRQQVHQLVPKISGPGQPGLVAMSMKKLPGKQKGFHDEFMDKYEEFSLSWREAIDREKRF